MNNIIPQHISLCENPAHLGWN
uniref:Uncharacterized protein n=1 Tax=Rhizophora mucronata TaxID=61149 RepID=A0A2P2NQB2_RHIMU